MKVYREVVRLMSEGGSGVLVTMIAVEGVTPCKPGVKMLVLADGRVFGTIGGGQVERKVQHLALEVLAENEPRLVSFGEPEDGALACGGKVTIFLEPVVGAPSLLIIGNGHVGQALAGAADGCGWQVLIVDDRPPPIESPGQFCRIDGYENPFAGLSVTRETSIVIAGRSHAVDLQSLRAALATDAGFIGLLGSRKKKAAFFSTLQEEGMSEEQLARVETPVGLEIGAQTPAEIAVSIMARLIQRRNFT